MIVKANFPLTKLYNYDIEAFEFFIAAGLSKSIANEKAQQVSWFQALARVTPKQAKEMGFKTMTALYSTVCEFLNGQGWQSWKMTSTEYLQRKASIFRYNQRAYENFLSEKLDNKNAAVKLTKEQIEYLLQCYRKTSPRSFAQALTKYNAYAQTQIGSGLWSKKTKSGKYVAILSRRVAIRVIKDKMKVWHGKRRNAPDVEDIRSQLLSDLERQQYCSRTYNF